MNIKHYLLIGIIGLLACNRPNNQTQQVSEKTSVSSRIEFQPIAKFHFRGININNKQIDIQGHIVVAEKYIDIFNNKKKERYFITGIKKYDNKVIVDSKNNRNEISKWEFQRGIKKTEITASINNSDAAFDISTGIYESLPFFSLSTDTVSSYKWNKRYQGQILKYSINIPELFNQEKPNRKNIDLKFADRNGSSILINVSSRQTDEYGVTAHNYNKQMFDDIFKQVAPNAKITYEEKIFVNNIEAYIFEEFGASKGLKSMHCYFYYNDKAIVITGTAEEKLFDDYRNLFRNCILSFKKL